MQQQMEESFGQYLRRRIDEMDTNVRQTALAMGVQPPTVSNWVNDKRRPSPESCILIADALGLDVDEVLDKAGHRPRMRADVDPSRVEIHKIVDLLPEPELDMVREYARWRLRESGSTPVQRPVRRPSQKGVTRA